MYLLINTEDFVAKEREREAEEDKKREEEMFAEELAELLHK